LGRIEKAIEEFRARRREVYKADSDQIVRDVHAAERATKDHSGRWFFELFQNCDDASAKEVIVLIAEQAIYVADKGKGLASTAIKSICGTDFSDKTVGTIGRKGVGFKAVYELTQRPQIFTTEGEGIEFSAERTRAWLTENGFAGDAVPYQWIPFFLSRFVAEREDSNLARLSGYSTVVKLPLASSGRCEEAAALLEWPTHALLPFPHVRTVVVQSAERDEPRLRLVVVPDGDMCNIEDSRLGNVHAEWQVVRHCEKPLDDFLRDLSQEERERVKKDGVGFLVAAPLEGMCVTPTREYLPVHVFYPTEQKGPVRMLLHAEFLVKSDRTALIPIENNAFNQWVADRLAYHVCDFVQDAYHAEEPSCHVTLLLPFEDTETHPVAAALWKRIAEKAREQLRLGNVRGEQRLNIDDAKLISVSVDVARARQILEAAEVCQHLLHQTFDDNKEARKALEALKCQETHDQDLMKVITDQATLKAADQEWVWNCWEWLAAWVAKEPYGDEHKKRIEVVQGLPVVPVGGRVLKPSDLAGHIVTWIGNAQAENLPNWLPLIFVDVWFRDRVLELRKSDETNSPILRLLKELGINEPGVDVVQRALGRAIEQHWKDKQGEPGRFLRYILQQDWHETTYYSTYDLRRCPVLTAHEEADGTTWVEARAAYFGERWGNDILSILYKGNSDVAWVIPIDTEPSIERQRKVLVWLGVADCPRVVEDKGEKSIWQLSQDCEDWKKFLQRSPDNLGRPVEKIESVYRLDRLSVNNLDAMPAISLLRLLANKWDVYYCSRIETEAQGSFSRERYYRTWKVKSLWWYDVCERLALPILCKYTTSVPLAKCWLPDKRTEHTIGDLLPIVDISAFADDKDVVRQWLVKYVGLRTCIEQLTLDEWREILSNRIPQVFPIEKIDSDYRLRDKVAKWYEVCLDATSDNDNIPAHCFKSCPVLCYKGKEWKYVKDELRYLADNSQLTSAFAEDVWLVDMLSRLKGAAERYFEIRSLSKSVDAVYVIPETRQDVSSEVQGSLRGALPYVFAWRLAQSKQDAEKLKSRLKSLVIRVVKELRVNLELNGISKEVVRSYVVNESGIFLCEADVGEPVLAQALAEALDVRTEADFYENLLRCKDSEERKTKLLAKGLTEADIDPPVREYEEAPSVEKVPDIPTGLSSAEQIIQPPVPGEKPKEIPPRLTPPPPIPPPTVPVAPKGDDKPFVLVDPQADYVVIEPDNRVLSGSGGGGGHSDPSPLSHEQKIEIENRGRAFAKRELTKSGYQVEEMPYDNPGFDLRATKNGRELRIEVKAHLGKGGVVDLTTRQYQEYLGRGGYDWQIWNIEHLRQSGSPVTITPYSSIPDEALDARTFRVDLKKCSG
jgi:hypothetical protein